MKATLDIPDELYRRVKARSAMEGRPIRSVAVDLFQKWLDEAPADAPRLAVGDMEEMPWLAIARRSESRYFSRPSAVGRRPGGSDRSRSQFRGR